MKWLRLAAGRSVPVRVALIWLGFAVLLLLLHWQRIGERQFFDPDDALRLIQVRDLLAGQGWFDLHQYRINPGDSPLMHWSRLVDAPLALTILVLSPLLGHELAEQAAIVLVPLLTLGAILAVIGHLAHRLFGGRAAILACLACGFSPPLLLQVMPLRIDHHGWQILAIVGALAGLAHSRPGPGGVLAGVAMALGLSISLEVLPMAAAYGGVLLLRWLRDPAQRWGLAGYLAALGAGLPLLFVLTRGLGDLAMHCDAISPAHLGFFAVTGVAGVILAASRIAAPAAVIGGHALAAALGAGLFSLLAPHCLAGPFAALDPLVRAYWYVNVLEGRPFWVQPPDQAVALILPALVALAASIHLWRNSEGKRRHWWLDYALLLFAALAGGLMVWRSMAFTGALCALPLGWLLDRMLARYRMAAGLGAKALIGLGALAVLQPAAPLVLARSVLPEKASPEGEAVNLQLSSCALRQSVKQLDRLPPAIFFAPLDIGPALLEQTRHSVIATSHHRAQAAMRDVILAFTGAEPEARRIIARHGAGYVVVCTDIAEPHIYATRAPGGLMARLLAGRAPPWLEEVRLDVPPSFRLWKVKG